MRTPPATPPSSRLSQPTVPAAWTVAQAPAWALAVPLALALTLLGPAPAAAQGTWLQTQCLAGAGTQTPCKAPPAWGLTGTNYVQALATAAGPGNLGLSLVKPESLPAANAARAQLAAVMLSYLDSRRPLVAYRWYGPVAAAAHDPRVPAAAVQGGAAQASAAPATVAEAGRLAPLNASAALPAARPTTASPNSGRLTPATVSIQSSWLGGALGDEPLALSASWWLTPTFFGATLPTPLDASADRYRVIRFLADHCPQLEGKVAPNAWTRCTRQ